MSIKGKKLSMFYLTIVQYTNFTLIVRCGKEYSQLVDGFLLTHFLVKHVVSRAHIILFFFEGSLFQFSAMIVNFDSGMLKAGN